MRHRSNTRIEHDVRQSAAPQVVADGERGLPAAGDDDIAFDRGRGTSTKGAIGEISHARILVADGDRTNGWARP